MNPDSTAAFQNLVGFGWIDGFMKWPGFIRLPLITLICLLLLGVPWLLGVDAGSVVSSFFLIVLCGSLLAIFVILARGAQQDLSEYSSEPLLLRESPALRLQTAVALLGGFLMVSGFGKIFEDDWFRWTDVFSAAEYARVGAGYAIIGWVVSLTPFLIGIIAVHLFAFLRFQSKVFCALVDEAQIDLLHMEQYEAFALQPMRYLLLLVILISIGIMSYLVLSVTLPEEVMIQFLELVFLFFLVPAVFVMRPVFRLRRRIRNAKRQELETVREALAGNRQVLASSCIAHMADEFNGPDLMVYEQRILGIWEWPVQGLVQRIVLYVLLPPLAWVLAALVERMIDAML